MGYPSLTPFAASTVRKDSPSEAWRTCVGWAPRAAKTCRRAWVLRPSIAFHPRGRPLWQFSLLSLELWVFFSSHLGQWERLWPHATEGLCRAIWFLLWVVICCARRVESRAPALSVAGTREASQEPLQQWGLHTAWVLWVLCTWKNSFWSASLMFLFFCEYRSPL